MCMPAVIVAEERKTPSQRMALVVFALANGEGLTTRNVMEMTRLGRRAAQKLMESLSGVLPIYRDEDDVWQICFTEEAKNVR